MSKRGSSSGDVHRKRILKEIEHLSSRGDLLIPKQSFRRLVNETLQNNGCEPYSIRVDAVDALQTASEDYLTEVLQAANNLAVYSNRDTVTDDDVRFVMGSPALSRGRAGEPLPPLEPPVQESEVASA
tara:strand:- start:1453 stop:1836 length:384 start_codon:yes stop_codon:yes gene_type:complete